MRTQTSSKYCWSFQSWTSSFPEVQTRQFGSGTSPRLTSSHASLIPLLWVSRRDLSARASPVPLTCIGSISVHTRPVEALDAYITPSNPPTAILFTADTMGAIKVWELEKETGSDGKPSIRPRSAGDDLNYHRTRVNQLVYGEGHVWTGKKKGFPACSS